MTAGAPRGAPVRADVPWLDPRAQRAWRSLQMMQGRLSSALARQLSAESDLSLQDYVVLVALTDRPDGRVRLFALADGLGWERSRLSHHVARMANRGFVRKERCPSDRRGAFVVVTDRGRQALEVAAPGHVASVRRLFVDVLGPDELDAIATASERVLEVLGGLDALAGADALDGSGAPG